LLLSHVLLQVLVFDFGSEMYVWTGKQVPFAQRKVGLRLAQELWDKGYDYTDCEVNPFSPLHSECLHPTIHQSVNLQITHNHTYYRAIQNINSQIPSSLLK